MTAGASEPRNRLSLWTGLTASITTLVIVLVVGFSLPLAFGGSLRLSRGHLVILGLLAGALVGTIAAMAARSVQGQLESMERTVDAWLRGNLALRLGDQSHSTIGRISGKLDQLVEHLEEDEQDLDRLGRSNVRLTDQVRALAVVEERNRLARELHDSVKQHLFSLAMTSSAVRTRLESLDGEASMPPATRGEIEEMVREMETAAQTAQRETTRLIEDLRPAPLQERGLVAALNDYTLLFGARQHLLVYLDVQCADLQLPALVTETLYRVAQEALHNVARHARATRVDVHLTCAADRVTLVIEDNGVGFDTRQTRRGLGISSMQERLIAAGGRLGVRSEPGTGTVVKAEVEVAQSAADRPLAQFPEPLGTDRARDAAIETAGPPNPEAWSWLGARLVIPVGQVWPWLPVDEARHLSKPPVSPQELNIRRARGWFGLRRAYVVLTEDRKTQVRLTWDRSGAHWTLNGADWSLSHVRGLKGRAVLERNDQPLAAMQYRGRQLDTWTEIVYAGRLYLVNYRDDVPGGFDLREQAGDSLLASAPQTGPGATATVTVLRELPLPLVIAAVARILEEAAVPRKAGRE
jgi:signal transduction histidine kinase